MTSTGEVELRPDPYVADGWEVFVNGVPSSHISADPLRLEYEYMRWIAAGCEAVIDSRLDASRLRVTHLGGGACSLARYFAARYPSARQTVVEVDAELARLVREWFDLPRAPRLKIRVGDARAVADGFRPGSRDVVIRDVFVGAVTPRPVTTMEFLAAVRRGLGPSGLYVANCGDHADLRLARSELRTMATVFARVGVIADPPMLKGRRYGNIVLLASMVGCRWRVMGCLRSLRNGYWLVRCRRSIGMMRGRGRLWLLGVGCVTTTRGWGYVMSCNV